MRTQRIVIDLALFLIFIFAVAHTAIAEAPAVLGARGGWIRLPPPGANAAGYLTFVNTTDELRRVIGVASDVAERTELHRSWVDDGVAHMRRVDAIEVPARGELELAPKGLHVMLIRPSTLKEGDHVELRFEVEGDGPLVVSLPVQRAAPGDSPTGH